MALQNTTMKRVLSATFQVRCYSAPAKRSIPAAKQKYVPTSGTYPKGFLAGTAHAGVKPSNTEYDDIAMVVAETRCAASAVYTKNRFRAAPVTFTQELMRARRGEGMRGVIVNSGCANAVTGHQGQQDAMDMAKATDKCFGDASEFVGSPRTCVMSTGVIGQKLPMDKITSAIPKAFEALGSTHEHWMKAAQAICTTDTFPKLISRQFTLPSHPGAEYTITGITKGAGMIHPNMGTLLGIICTDANIARTSMQPLLRMACNKSFNCISIDGDTSTNDTVALFANGAAAPPDAEAVGYPPRTEPFVHGFSTPAPVSEDCKAFGEVLIDFMADLAKLVVRDGEGATKFITIRVQTLNDKTIAHRVAENIAKSPLVKTALYGKDANWGRILCAIGYTPGVISDYQSKQRAWGKGGDTVLGNPVKIGRTSVSFIPADGSEELKLLTKGEPEEVDEARAKEILEMEDLEILVKLHDGKTHKKGKVDAANLVEAVYWTCDFSHEYVTINGDYRT